MAGAGGQGSRKICNFFSLVAGLYVCGLPADSNFLTCLYRREKGEFGGGLFFLGLQFVWWQ